jgi:hypothetical protein
LALPSDFGKALNHITQEKRHDHHHGVDVELEAVVRSLGLTMSRLGGTVTLSDPCAGLLLFDLLKGKSNGETTARFAEAVIALRRKQADLLNNRFESGGVRWSLYDDDFGDDEFEVWEAGFEAVDENDAILNQDGFIPLGLREEQLMQHAEGLLAR